IRRVHGGRRRAGPACDVLRIPRTGPRPRVTAIPAELGYPALRIGWRNHGPISSAVEPQAPQCDRMGAALSECSRWMATHVGTDGRGIDCNGPGLPCVENRLGRSL